MTWLYKGSAIDEIPDDCIGFVYIIVNNTNGRKYIGKKLSKFSKVTYKTIKLKNGKKKRQRIKSKVVSDWKEYWSSSDELKNDVSTLGYENFTREILFLCKTKSECSYLEAKEQFDRKVLESDDYYNGIINLRVNKKHIMGKL